MKKELTKKLLFELLKDSKRSDRELAKVLGVSQPTVTRRRNQLVEDGIIREFTVIPDFVKMGYEIMSVNLFKSEVTQELREKAQKKTDADPHIIFAARGHGMGKNGIVISMHKNFADYSKFIAQVLSEGGKGVEGYESFIISLGDFVAKPFSLKSLAEDEEPIKF
jgi:DNA-binding Lrp family transcriptional regulator